MGMTAHQLRLVAAVADNNLKKAKEYAMACCEEDTTQKNRVQVERYKKMLQAPAPCLMELPRSTQNFATLEDLSNTYKENRYFLSDREKAVFERIQNLYTVAQWLEEKQIPFHNTILLYGESGTGKTEFSRYVAYKTGLPYLYVNLSRMIDSYLGKTAKNLSDLFAFVRQQPCVLMLDEIDAIAARRAYSEGAAGAEIARSTTCLIQMLDSVQNNHIIISATNIPDKIDPAVKRRFAERYEVQKLTVEDNYRFICQYMEDTGIPFDEKSAREYAQKDVIQAQILDHIVRSIVEMRISGKTMARF